MKGTYWTEDEEKILIDMCEKGVAQSKIAKILGRSSQSIKGKRMRMGLDGMKESTDKLTLADVADLCGIARSNVTKTWCKRGLRAREQGGHKYVSENAIVRFMKKNPDLWIAKKCDWYFFSKYDWFIERLESERNGTYQYKSKQRRKMWTTHEIARLKMYQRKGMSIREMSTELGRSWNSVYNFLSRMEVKDA